MAAFQAQRKRKLEEGVGAGDGEAVYFNGYLDHAVHKKMLLDKARMKMYREAFERNAHLFKGKVVMDIGAGTGILSLLAARLGAKQVFSVEASAMAKYCTKTAEENGYGDVITVINGKVEEIGTVLPGDVQKVDVIISEWMGLLLVQESVLDSVLYARDQFLRPNGVLFPSHARIYFCPVSMESEMNVWDDIEGFHFSTLKAYAKDQLIVNSPLRRHLAASDLVSSPKLFKYFNLKTMKVESVQQMRSSNLPFVVDRPFDAIAVWFDVRFAYCDKSKDSGSGGTAVILSTSPKEEARTHWGQAVIVLPQTVPAEKGQKLHISCEMGQSEPNHRLYEVSFNIQ
jgi:protein arginine N-methyltransferase 1|tara:strand:+ start:22 stop:1047 length:1026 start_codon:yes stop_codon:yes gene_type:complete